VLRNCKNTSNFNTEPSGHLPSSALPFPMDDDDGAHMCNGSDDEEAAFQQAAGFLMLGLLDDCEDLLDSLQASPDFAINLADLRINLAAERKDWHRMLELSLHVITAYPDQLWGYIHRSYALREVGQIQTALDTLAIALKRADSAKASPLETSVLHYNIACYQCLLHRKEEAFQNLQKAVSIDPRLMLDAKSDEDLKEVVELLDY